MLHMMNASTIGAVLLPDFKVAFLLSLLLLLLLMPAEPCLAAAFKAVNPDESPPCPSFEGASLLKCLTTPSFQRILVLADFKLNASMLPPSMTDNPFLIDRNVTLEGDGRGPRLMLDCSLLTDRFQVAAGVTVTVHHLTLSNCSIGTEKPLSIMRFNQGSKLVINDSSLLQPNNLCLPQPQQASLLLHEPRAAAIPGTQAVRVGEASAWCAANPNTRAQPSSSPDLPGLQAGRVDVDATSSASDNNSYSRLPPLPQVFANRTGLGPVYAATLDQPARAAFFTHPT